MRPLRKREAAVSLDYEVVLRPARRGDTAASHSLSLQVEPRLSEYCAQLSHSTGDREAREIRRKVTSRTGPTQATASHFRPAHGNTVP